MLYLILPPIIIVLAGGLLILLLMRRAKERGPDGLGAQNFGPAQTTAPAQPAQRVQHTQQMFARAAGKLRPPSLPQFGPVRKSFSDKVSSLFKRTPKREQIVQQAQQEMQEQLHPEMAAAQPAEEPVVPENAQEMIQQSTLSFIRRRVLLQEQRRAASSAGSDVAAPGEPHGMQYSEQEDALVTRLAENPHDIAAYEQLGAYYYERGTYDDARECFKQILKLDPRNRRAQTAMQHIDHAQ